MGERKGQNKYYPPDFDPRKHGNLNRYHGTHALRERAKKIKQGIIVIRFELPFNIWCDGCGNSVATGVRYNAEKTKIDMYYSTPIYEFKMRCHLCPNHFTIKTDPQKLNYIITSGARRKELRWDPSENEQLIHTPGMVLQKMNEDPMFKLDHEMDKQKAYEKSDNVPSLSKLLNVRSEWKDDYNINIFLRDKFRIQKNIKRADQRIANRLNLSVPLISERSDDVKIAKSLFKNRQKPNSTPIETLKKNIKRNSKIYAKPSKPPSKSPKLIEYDLSD
ncbi:Coiled-coil domain-containing protein [Intoshia linei]|uniref:Coiled-coil domain-containing protein n=1 Tax=Intoshia linei TaxID=1819745 RepID=A0A177ASG3_9BILA|nr:Coiled-coil domain-containing protein [Intoshia linei]